MRLGARWYTLCFQTLMVVVGAGALAMGLFNATSHGHLVFEVKGYEVHYRGWQVYLVSVFFWVCGAGLIRLGLSDRIVRAFEDDE